MRFTCFLGWAQVAALIFSVAACGSDDNTSSSGAGAGTQSSSTTAAGGQGGAGVGGGGATGGGGGGEYTPPPTHAACDAPMTSSLGLWTAAAGQRFWSTRLAWGGSEAAVAYAESTGMGTWDIQFQRLLETSLTKGGRVTVGKAVGNFGPHIAVATNGESYVVCWDSATDATTMACAALPLETGNAKAGLAIKGTAPALAFGVGGWALVYASGGDIVAQRLGDDAKAVGAAATIASASAPVPAIAATPTGFAVGYGNVEMQRLDGKLAPSGDAVHVGAAKSGTPFLGFASSGEKIGVAWDDTSEVGFTMLDESNAPTPRAKIDPAGSQPAYGQIAAAGGLDSFAVAWSAFEGFVGYRPIDGAGKPTGSVAQPINAEWDDSPVSVVAVSDGFLVAAATGLAVDTMKIAHLACP